MLRAVSEDPGHISRICLSVLRSGCAFRGDNAGDIAACQAIFCNLRTVGPPGAPFELRRSLLALRFSRLSAARDHSFAQISTLNSRIWQSFLHAASRRRTCAASGTLDQSRTRRKPQGALAERRRGQSLQRLRDTCASTVVVLGSAAYTSRKPRAVCGSVTNIPARAVLAGTCAQSPVRCDGLARRNARGPSPQQRPGVGSRPPAACLAGCNPAAAAAAHRAAHRAMCGPGPGPDSGQIPWAPRQRVGPGGAGYWRLTRLVQLLRSAASGPPAGGGWQQPEADFLKCRSGPKWQRRAAAGYGHAREKHAI